MDPDKINLVDDYLTQVVLHPSQAHTQTLTHLVDQGLPSISVSAPLGGLIKVLARATGGKRILEIGTLGGYSTIWLAQALAEGGEIITLEFDPHHAEVARQNLTANGIGDEVKIIVGAALDTLPTLTGPFDFIFVDADKKNIPHYLEWGIKLSRPGTMILIDNVVRDGRVLEEDSEDPDTIGVRKLHEILGSLEGVSATAIQMVGHKGWDGFSLVTVH